ATGRPIFPMPTMPTFVLIMLFSSLIRVAATRATARVARTIHGDVENGQLGIVRAALAVALGPRGILVLLDVIASIRIVDGNGETALVELPGSEFEGAHAAFVERVFPGDDFRLLK